MLPTLYLPKNEPRSHGSRSRSPSPRRSNLSVSRESIVDFLISLTIITTELSSLNVPILQDMTSYEEANSMYPSLSRDAVDAAKKELESEFEASIAEYNAGKKSIMEQLESLREKLMALK